MARLVLVGLGLSRDFVGHGHLGCAGTGNHHGFADVGEATRFIDPGCRGDVNRLTRLLVRDRNEGQEVQADALVRQPLVDFFEKSLLEGALVEFDDVLVREEFADQVAQPLVDDGIFRRFVLRATVGFVFGLRIRATDVLGFVDEGPTVNDRVFVGDFNVRQDSLLERRTELRFAGHRVIGNRDLVGARPDLGTDGIAGWNQRPGHTTVVGDQRLLVGLSTTATGEGDGRECESQNGFAGSLHCVISPDWECSVGRQVGSHQPPDGAVRAVDDEDRPNDAEQHRQENRGRHVVLPDEEGHEPAVEQANGQNEHHEGAQKTKKFQGSSPVSFPQETENGHCLGQEDDLIC